MRSGVASAGYPVRLAPRRIRRIDDRLRDAGLSWSPEATARLDKLLMLRGILQRLWCQMPEGSWDLLNNPAVVPACFQQLLDPQRR
jgi:hypothetical protein